MTGKPELKADIAIPKHGLLIGGEGLAAIALEPEWTDYQRQWIALYERKAKADGLRHAADLYRMQNGQTDGTFEWFCNIAEQIEAGGDGEPE